ncbi:MAG: glycosyltransferase [Mycobacteriaceae bacterium]|nr:glycosyltransferase [Mycobacteriaceae bacterium]
MKFVLACYGTRGDIEPGIVLGRELLRRGHQVQMAVAPDMVAGVEAAGIPAVGYGLDTQAEIDSHRDFWTSLFRNFWKIREVAKSWREVWDRGIQSSEEMSATLVSLAEGADVLVSGISFQEGAANIAEYYDIPLVTLHTFPMRAHGYVLPFLPAWAGRSAMTALWWLHWRMTKKVDDTQRRELGLPKATAPSWRRIADRGSLELQAYDEICFPDLASEWSEFANQRPFVGALTMESPTAADNEVASWIAAGTPPILFGFGSIPVASPADTLDMIAEACTQLGERALVCSAWSDFTGLPQFEHVKVVDGVDFEATFPVCRAVVHHGGAGTTAVSLRAGIPTLILWTWPDQSLRGGAVTRLRVGTARRFSSTNLTTLVGDLRTILRPEYRDRAREVAPRITKPAESISVATGLLETLPAAGAAADR